MKTNVSMREKFKVRSPNCADTLMMSERIHDIISQTEEINFASLY